MSIYPNRTITVTDVNGKTTETQYEYDTYDVSRQGFTVAELSRLFHTLFQIEPTVEGRYRIKQQGIYYGYLQATASSKFIVTLWSTEKDPNSIASTIKDKLKELVNLEKNIQLLDIVRGRVVDDSSYS